MKKVLFIDRDGTLVLEPPVDYQLDSLEKLEYYPKVFQYMAKIASELDYQTNYIKKDLEIYQLIKFTFLMV